MIRSGLLLAVLCLLSGCGSDDPSRPADFQVQIIVRDAQGDPVEGLDLTMVPHGPWYMDGQAMKKAGDFPYQDRISLPSPNPFFPLTILRYEAAQTCWAELIIEDVTGVAVRDLVVQEIPEGSHAVMWDGQGEVEGFVPSGIYFAHLTLFEAEGGDVLFDGSQALLFAHWGDSSPTLGTTDTSGRVTLTDRRLFPFLHNVAPFPSTNENGEITGLIELGPTMRFYLADSSGGHMMRFDEDVTGSKTLNFTWEY